MSVKGGSYVTFKRAVAAGQALPALAAAHELGRLTLVDALALTCVLRSDARRREAGAAALAAVCEAYGRADLVSVLDLALGEA